MSSKKKRKVVDDQVDEDDTDERYFLDPKSVSVHLYCSICQEVFNEPQRAPCGHSFCKNCILQWLNVNKSCPEDRKKLTIKQLHHDFILENIIGDQKVACPYRRGGCDFIGTLNNLKSHRKTCAFNPKNMPEFLRNDRYSIECYQKCDSDDEADIEDLELPTPVKPSLKMRLFTSGGERRDMLCNMFETSPN